MLLGVPELSNQAPPRPLLLLVMSADVMGDCQDPAGAVSICVIADEALACVRMCVIGEWMAGARQRKTVSGHKRWTGCG